MSSLEDNVFAAFVTVGRVSWNLGVAAWAGLQSETFASYVLVHHSARVSSATIDLCVSIFSLGIQSPPRIKGLSSVRFNLTIGHCEVHI